MKKSRLLGAVYACLFAGLMISTPAMSASTIWVPTDGDVQVSFTNPATGTIGLFDDISAAVGAETIITGAALPLATFDLVTFAASGMDFTATNQANSFITLTDTKQFVLGYKPDGGNDWLADTATIDHGNNTFTVVFDNAGTTYLIDVENVTPPAAIPVPPAVWLFGSGLLGLVGMARRKKTA